MMQSMNILRILLTATCLCTVWLSTGAQTLRVSINFADSTLRQMKWYMIAMDNQSSEDVTELAVRGTSRSGALPAAAAGFYRLIGVSEQTQLVHPLYLPDTEKEQVVDISAEGRYLRTDKDADNRALSAFSAVVHRKGEELWTGEGRTAGQCLAFLKEYAVKADSIAETCSCSAPVRQYLSLWAYTTVFNDYEGLPYILKLARGESLPFALHDVLAEPQMVLDNDMATYFPSFPFIIYRTLPRGSVDGKIAYVRTHYACEAVRIRVENMVIDNFIRNFDYNGHFASGLDELEAVVGKYNLDRHYVEDFKVRRSTVKGAPFPEGVTLTDAGGGSVDFLTAFKGKYVYVDLWASWCMPCCKEVPHLQRLEEELGNEDVVFVSISIDSKPEAWKKKMQALGMTGNQLIDIDNRLCKMLNISGIPFFLIYDKEGKLHTYDAMRPSRGAELKEMLESLH